MLKKLLFSKRFWAIFILVLFLCIVLDITLSVFIIGKALISGAWSKQIEIVGMLYVITNVLANKTNWGNRSELKMASRVLLIVGFLWSFGQYGFLKAVYFTIVCFVVARVGRFIARIVRYQREALH